MLLKTPETIRTLQRKLYCKAKQEPACRFHALYDKVYRADILSHAYNLVRANKGSAGIDGVTFAAIEEQEGVTAFIAELENALRNKTYKPNPVTPYDPAWSNYFKRRATQREAQRMSDRRFLSTCPLQRQIG